jgi:uncharacterized membrane protein YfbV (UPF0208 family)
VPVPSVWARRGGFQRVLDQSGEAYLASVETRVRAMTRHRNGRVGPPVAVSAVPMISVLGTAAKVSVVPTVVTVSVAQMVSAVGTALGFRVISVIPTVSVVRTVLLWMTTRKRKRPQNSTDLNSMAG